MCNTRHERSLNGVSVTSSGVNASAMGGAKEEGVTRSVGRGGVSNGYDRDVMSLLEYVNELCTEICDVISSSVSKIYHAAPSGSGNGSHTNNPLYEPLRKHGKYMYK